MNLKQDFNLSHFCDTGIPFKIGTESVLPLTLFGLWINDIDSEVHICCLNIIYLWVERNIKLFKTLVVAYYFPCITQTIQIGHVIFLRLQISFWNEKRTLFIISNHMRNLKKSFKMRNDIISSYRRNTLINIKYF